MNLCLDKGNNEVSHGNSLSEVTIAIKTRRKLEQRDNGPLLAKIALSPKSLSKADRYGEYDTLET